MGLDARPEDPLHDLGVGPRRRRRSSGSTRTTTSHHTYTNILGKDNDLGYGILRVDEDQPWKPRHLVQPLCNVAHRLHLRVRRRAYDLELGDDLREKRDRPGGRGSTASDAGARPRGRSTKDYVVWPAAVRAVGGARRWPRNLTANLVRNVWSHSVIMCGHFPEGVETFEHERARPDDETRGEWYVRQMLGSANISGPPSLHLMTGNLSHQIEHHLFPDLPSNRYAEIAPRVRALFDALRPHLPRGAAAAAGRERLAQGASGCRCPTVG